MPAFGNLLAFPLSLLGRARRRLDELLLTQRDGVALTALAPLGGRFVPITQYSMRPSGVLALVNEIMLNRCRCIVECGAGMSTIYMARALRACEDGGRITSFDHDEEWLALIREALRAEGLEDIVALVHAPLTAGDWGMGPCRWYDPQIVVTALRSKVIDLLVVDGPVASGPAQRYARFPAIPILRPFFSDSVTTVLDDIDRMGEQEVIRRWEGILSVKFDQRPLAGRIALARCGSGRTT